MSVFEGEGADKLRDGGEESRLLASVYQSETAWLTVSDRITADWFGYPANKALWGVINEMRTAKVVPSPVVVYDRLPEDVKKQLDELGGWTYLENLGTLPIDPSSVEYHAKKLEDLMVLRRGLRAGEQIMFHATQSSSKDDYLNKVEEIVNEIPGPISSEIVLLGGIAEDFVKKKLASPKEIPGLSSGYPILDAELQGFQPGRMYVLGARKKTGKALAVETPIPTPEGWKLMGDLVVGDKVFGEDGKPTSVVGVTETWSDRPCYAVKFGVDTIIADKEHEWMIRYRDREMIVTTHTLKTLLESHRWGARPQIKVTEALELPDRELPLSPYVLGAWLGDGSSRSPQITCADTEILEFIQAEGVAVRPLRSPMQFALGGNVGAGHSLKRLSWESVVEIRSALSRGVSGKDLSMQFGVSRSLVSLIRTGQIWREQPSVTFKSVLQGLNVLQNKHIPTAYLRSSRSQRLALLQGLMDTDGHIDERGACEFTNTNRDLIDGVCELISSLGLKFSLSEGRATLSGKDCGAKWRIFFTPSIDMPVFRLSRKLIRQRIVSPTARSNWRAVESVEEVPSRSVRCIQVNNDSNLYLAGRAMIPTHNSVWLLNLVKHMAVDNEIPVLYISTEQTQEDEVSRLLSMTSEVPEKYLGNGMFGDMSDYFERMEYATEKIKNAPIYFQHDPFFSLGKLRRVIKKYVLLHGVQCVFFDYIKIPSENIGGRDKWAAVGDLAYGLKACASEQSVPVITAVQVNRDGAESFKFTGDIDSDAFAQSDMIAQAMSVGMILRPLNKEEKEEHAWAGEKRILKVTDNRHGASSYKGLFAFDNEIISLKERKRLDA